MGETTLTLKNEEAMALQDMLCGKERTISVQVSVVFEDGKGVEYVAERVIKMKIKRRK